MNGCNLRKAEQLGMPLGTATHRLRKIVLFSLVQKMQLDVCFKCGLTIRSVDDLTIEHKQPWYEVDTDLFWDIDNIAFSHAKCNIPHRYGRRLPLKHGTSGKYQKGCRCDLCVQYNKDRRKRQSPWAP